MTRWFEEHTVRSLGRFRVVEPTVVVEVAFDVIQRSARHQSGFALRFPRIVRLRADKPAAEIDTLATVERLHTDLQSGAEYLITAEVRRPACADVPAERQGGGALMDHRRSVEPAAILRGMFTEFTPLVQLALTIATDSMIVEGKLTTRRPRLTTCSTTPTTTT